MSIVPQKHCNRGDKCVHPLGSLQPATTEHFQVCNASKDGLRGNCKACGSAEWKERYNANPLTISKRIQAEIRKAQMPSPEERRRLTLERYAKNHPERIKQSKRDWKLRNPDKVKADNRAPRAKIKA